MVSLGQCRATLSHERADCLLTGDGSGHYNLTCNSFFLFFFSNNFEYYEVKYIRS